MELKSAARIEPKPFTSMLRDSHAEERRDTLTAVERRAEKSRVSDEQIEDAFNRGLTNREIAQETKLSITSVQIRLRRLELKRPGSRTYTKKVPDEVIRKAWEEGGSYGIIAEKAGMSEPGLRHRLKDLGLGPNRLRIIKDEILLDELEAGMTQTEISRKHNVVPGAVYRMVKRLMPEIEKRGIAIVKEEPQNKKISDDEILEGLGAGLSKAEIARQHSVSQSSITRRMKKLMPEIEKRGIEVMDGVRGVRNRKISDEDVLEGLEAGLTQAEIARRHDVSHTAVYSIVKRLRSEIENAE